MSLVCEEISMARVSTYSKHDPGSYGTFSFVDKSSSSKKSKEDDEGTDSDDREYEEWKRRILESATKAIQSQDKKSTDKDNS